MNFLRSLITDWPLDRFETALLAFIVAVCMAGIQFAAAAA